MMLELKNVIKTISYVFFFSSSSFIPWPCLLSLSSNGMMNVQADSLTPLLGWQCGANDLVASNSLYQKKPIALLEHSRTYKTVSGVTYWSYVCIVSSSEFLPPINGCCSSTAPEGQWTWVVTCVYNVILHLFACSLAMVHPIPLKGWISVQGHRGLTSGFTVTLSWEINEARAQKGSHRTVHICTNQHCFVTTIFSQLCQMWSGGTNVLHFTHLHRIFTHK